MVSFSTLAPVPFMDYGDSLLLLDFCYGYFYQVYNSYISILHRLIKARDDRNAGSIFTVV